MSLRLKIRKGLRDRGTVPVFVLPDVACVYEIMNCGVLCFLCIVFPVNIAFLECNVCCVSCLYCVSYFLSIVSPVFHVRVPSVLILLCFLHVLSFLSDLCD